MDFRFKEYDSTFYRISSIGYVSQYFSEYRTNAMTIICLILSCLVTICFWKRLQAIF